MSAISDVTSFWCQLSTLFPILQRRALRCAEASFPPERPQRGIVRAPTTIGSPATASVLSGAHLYRSTIRWPSVGDFQCSRSSFELSQSALQPDACAGIVRKRPRSPAQALQLAQFIPSHDPRGRVRLHQWRRPLAGSRRPPVSKDLAGTR